MQPSLWALLMKRTLQSIVKQSIQSIEKEYAVGDVVVACNVIVTFILIIIII